MNLILNKVGRGGWGGGDEACEPENNDIGCSKGGNPGESYGIDPHGTLYPGSGGGGGARNPSIRGGAGGAALLLYAQEIIINGSIKVNGNDGHSGNDE